MEESKVDQIYALTGGLTIEECREVMLHMMDAAFSAGYEYALSEENGLVAVSM